MVNSMPPSETNRNPQRRKVEGSNLSLIATQKNKQTGVKHAIQKCKRRRDVKFRQKASLLRQYQKTLKREGNVTNTSQLRRRRRNEVLEKQGANETDTGLMKTGNKPSDEAKPSTTAPRQRQPKMDPFKKSLERVQQRREMAIEEKKQRKIKEKQAVQREKQRHRQSKKLRQRTYKGQPVMKHVIGGLLDHIQGDKR